MNTQDDKVNQYRAEKFKETRWIIAGAPERTTPAPCIGVLIVAK